uniref:Uncharacterized protein n=1 Tax=Anguilla anguilla TaxID=7936 RepID=A0A0E9QB99_ANGAN
MTLRLPNSYHIKIYIQKYLYSTKRLKSVNIES